MAGQSLSYEQYLNVLPPDRRREVEAVWRVVRENMPAGYSEEFGPKFLMFKAGADSYVALASQKNYISLYLTPLYVFPELREMLGEGGSKLKAGKACINFKRADELPLEAIARIIAANDAQAYSERLRQMKSGGKKKKPSGR